MSLPTETLRDAYRRMLLCRGFEQRCTELFQKGVIRGSLHLSIGQEATAVGAALALRQDDLLLTNYRGHSHALAKGISPRAAMAEMLGKETGCCKGKGGSMHWTDTTHGIMPANAVVAAGLPIAVGCALAGKLDKLDRVAITFFGDGATNQGVFHEALNLASVWQAPVIFFCENNLYSEMTPIAFTSPNKDLAERADAYHIPAEIVDGNDIEAVYQAVTRGVERGRHGGGPTFIEAKTYRLVGHMIGDSEVYRTREEVEVWRKQDPIARLRARLLESGVPETALEEDVQSVNRVLDDAVAFAMDSPWPEVDEIYADMFAGPVGS
ncbi:MAG: thiamine pyrophosphate-dependent dehydrogenase E1 component subunit alpha [Chloroflexi bacterium]|nr:thiamine pyrophosphate-dependent dehydrogenase E1 component subunit alpha [Chloroflexota bacterium]